jgi:hypothetical protein
VSNCISVTGKLDMVKRELTWENLIQPRKILTEQHKELGA